MADKRPRVHTLKCWPDYFDAILSGKKRCELRRDDRGGFKPNDVLHLMDWDPEPEDDLSGPRGYTGRQLFVLVTHVVMSNDDENDYLPSDVSRALQGMALMSIKLLAGVNHGFDEDSEVDRG